MQRVFNQAQCPIDVLAALVDDRVVGMFEQWLAVNGQQLQGPDIVDIQRLITHRQVSAELLATCRQRQRRLELLVELRQRVEGLQASVWGEQQDLAEVFSRRQALYDRAGFTRKHKGPGELHGFILVAEVERIHPRSIVRASGAVFNHALFGGAQQVIAHIKLGLLLQRAKASRLGEVALTALIVHCADFVKALQVGVQVGFELGEQGFAGFLGEVCPRQCLKQAA